MSWRDYRGAPASGAELARSDEAPEGAAVVIDVDGFSIVLARGPRGLAAFVNACPHQYLPLDYKGDRILSADGATLRCTNHSAGFDAASGEGVEGLGLGCALDKIPVVERGGAIFIGG